MKPATLLTALLAGQALAAPVPDDAAAVESRGYTTYGDYKDAGKGIKYTTYGSYAGAGAAAPAPAPAPAPSKYTSYGTYPTKYTTYGRYKRVEAWVRSLFA